ncbi:MAG: hypothetical protein AB2L14_36665 [Candidatus Xenobiia bacterium LiM19]
MDRKQRKSAGPEDVPLLTPLHYMAAGAVSFILSMIMFADSFRYLDLGMLAIFGAVVFILMACFIPFLSLIVYYNRQSGPKGAALCAAILSAAVAGAALYLSQSQQYLFEQIPFVIIFISFTLGILSFTAALLIAMKSHWGAKGAAGGLVLILPLLYALAGLRDYDGNTGCALAFVFLASLTIYAMIPTRANPLKNTVNVFTVLAILVALGVILAPNFLRARSPGHSHRVQEQPEEYRDCP